jgi:hypothetical protein
MCDKKQKHVAFSAAAAKSIAERARQALFGEIGAAFVERPIVPDDVDFGDRGFFSRALRGTLLSIEPSPKPVVFFASADLAALPVELLFPRNAVVRGWAFARFLLHPRASNAPLRAVVYRWRARKEYLLECAAQRTAEAVATLVSGCGPAPPFLPAVSGAERAMPFPFPLFSSRMENAAYASKYPFCDFCDLSSEAMPGQEFALHIFTYGDFCEMSATVHDFVTRFPSAFFLFIPGQFVREAFAILSAIFERQVRRCQYVRESEAGAAAATKSMMLHCAVARVAYDFVSLLQGTLIAQLGCPVILLSPGE